MTRVLVIRFSSIGDIVLTTPVIRALKSQLEGEVELHYLTKASFAPILENNPYVDRLWTMTDSLDEVVEELADIDFDYLIDLHRNLRTSVVKRKVKGLYFTFDKLNWKKYLWVNFGINKLPDVHIVDRYMDAIRAFSTQDDGQGLDYFIPEDVQVDLQVFSLSPQGYVAWVIGAAHEGKRFSAAKVTGIVDRLKIPVVLLGGKADVDMAEEIMRSTQAHVVNMVGRTTLHESAWLLRESQVVVTPDTGMMHIAAAWKKRIISLWGCTVPEFGMYPYRPGEGSVMLQPRDKSKRPCSKLGNRCKYPVNCIESIEDDEVVRVLKSES
ncbi:MAG: glycosyltransferase family 9 protein [Flavobacteriales bacterium]|nr:glycosyltransferase family 9 protein [Flavobacteriales bacterium]